MPAAPAARRAAVCVLIGLLAALLVVSNPWVQVAGGAVDPVTEEQREVEAELQAAAAQEAELLGQLFTLNRRLDEVRQEIERLGVRVAAKEEELMQAEASLSRLVAAYEQRRTLMGRRLRFLQEHGRIPFLAVLMAATDFNDFLRRAEAVQTVLQHDARLLAEWRALRRQVEAGGKQLQEQRAELLSLQAALTADQAALAVMVAGREAALAALHEDRERLEIRLADLDVRWLEAVAPVLNGLGEALAQVAGRLQEVEPQSVTFRLFPPGLTMTLAAEQFNAVLEAMASLDQLRLGITAEEIELGGHFAGVELQVRGRFEIISDYVLRFTPREIRFDGFEVPAEYVEELTQQGDFDMQLDEVIAPGRLESIQQEPGRLMVHTRLGR